MKLKLKPLSWSLALVFSTATCQLASAASADLSVEPVFQVDDVVLVRQADVLTKKTQQQVLDALATVKGPGRTMLAVNAAIQKAQGVLDKVAPGAFVLRLVPETIATKGNVVVTVNPVLSQVTAKDIGGADAQAVLANLPPTLQKGALLEGEKWPTAQTLGILNEHPLKVTNLQYRLERDKPVTADVSVLEPFGKSQTSVTLDSNGNDVIGRGMLSLSHLRSDVATLGDVLSLSGSTTAQNLGKVSLAAVRYTVPDMAAFASHTLGLVHSQSNVDSPFLAFGNVNGQGRYDELSYRQNRYLNWGSDSGWSGTKVYADLAWSRAQAKTEFLSSTLTDYAVTSVPIKLGLESTLRSGSAQGPRTFKDFSALVNAEVVINRAGWGSDQAEYERARAGADSSTTVRLLLDTQATLWDAVRVKAVVSGQWTNDKLLPSGQMAITGGRTGVRGFVNAVQFGDSAQVLRTEVEPLAWSGNWNGAVLQSYAFYDVGQKSGGNDMQSLTLASAGFGLRLAPVKVEGFSADVFAARKTQGSELDLTPASRSVVNENTLWATVTYRF